MEVSRLSPPVSVVGNPLTTRARLDFLDGIRALAALYVCFFHAMLIAITPRYPDALLGEFPGLSTLSVGAIKFLRAGHFAVSIFIVLSGYCLMLPALKHGGRLPDGVTTFLRRRARRVLPSYYAALTLSLLLTWLIPGMRHARGSAWAAAIPIWDWRTLLSHLLLFQNWSWQWYFKVDPVAWSMATEAQIYLIFAFVLLPLTRRMGMAGTTVLAFWAGLEVHWYFNGRYDFIYWSYVGLFSLGMLGATIGFSPAPWAKLCRERLPWGVSAMLAWTLVIRVYLSPGEPWMQNNMWLADPLIGTATFLVMVFCTQALTAPSAGPPPILRVLEAKPLVQVGGFSYSLYLIHFPVLVVLSLVLQPLGLGVSAGLWVMLGLCLPVCIPVAYWFYRVFEQPGQKSLQSGSNRSPLLHVRSTTVGKGTAAGPAGRGWRVASLEGVGAVIFLGLLLASLPNILDRHRSRRLSVERAIAASHANHRSACKVLLVPRGYGSLATAVGVQLAHAGEPFVVARETGGENTSITPHDWQSLSVKTLQDGLSPWYIVPLGSTRSGLRADIPNFPLRDDAALVLTPPVLKLSAVGSKAEMNFAHNGNAADFMLGGWSSMDPGGTWTEAPWAALVFQPQVVKGTHVEVFVDGLPLVVPSYGITRQRVRLYFNGTPIYPEQQLSAAGTVQYTIPATIWNAAATKPEPQASLAFEFADAVTPATLDSKGGNTDHRDLALFVSKVRLQVAP